MDTCGWSTPKTRCLITIWAEESEERMGDSYHTRMIFEDISKKMVENGYS